MVLTDSLHIETVIVDPDIENLRVLAVLFALLMSFVPKC